MSLPSKSCSIGNAIKSFGEFIATTRFVQWLGRAVENMTNKLFGNTTAKKVNQRQESLFKGKVMEKTYDVNAEKLTDKRTKLNKLAESVKSVKESPSNESINKESVETSSNFDELADAFVESLKERELKNEQEIIKRLEKIEKEEPKLV